MMSNLGVLWGVTTHGNESLEHFVTGVQTEMNLKHLSAET